MRPDVNAKSNASGRPLVEEIPLGNHTSAGRRAAPSDLQRMPSSFGRVGNKPAFSRSGLSPACCASQNDNQHQLLNGTSNHHGGHGSTRLTRTPCDLEGQVDSDEELIDQQQQNSDTPNK